jgi:hypothetical protein
MFKSWRRTESINIAATFLTCGVQVCPLSVYDAHSGKRTTTFDLIGDGHLPAEPLPDSDPLHIRARFNLHTGEPGEAWIIYPAAIRRPLESGELENGDPCHPTLDVLRTLEARECLLTYMNRQTPYRIAVHPTAARARLAPGNEPMASRLGQPGFETWTTESIVIASCMARIGVPVLTIHGEHPRRCFILPRFGYRLPGRPGPEDATALLAVLQNGELAKFCPEHPLVWGQAGLKARRILRNALDSKDSSINQVLLRFDKSTSWQRNRRSAMIEERATSKVEADAIKHLRA